MQVQAGAGEVPERLRHEGGGHAGLVRDRVHHVAEEDEPVGGRERVGEGEVLLELAVRVLVVVGVVRPAELVHVPRHRGQVVEHPGQALGVVAGHARTGRAGRPARCRPRPAAGPGSTPPRSPRCRRSRARAPSPASPSGSGAGCTATARPRRRCRTAARRAPAATARACTTRGPAPRSCRGPPGSGPSARPRTRRSPPRRAARRARWPGSSWRTACRACPRTWRRRTRRRPTLPVREVRPQRLAYALPVVSVAVSSGPAVLHRTG